MNMPEGPPLGRPGEYRKACKLTVIIKALNEEKRIQAAVESALRVVSPMGGEVVLADSCSTDRTVEIASQYPIRIVRLEDAAERCCGAGPQLGYQHSRGEFVYILDGDMQMLDGFITEAIGFLERHADVAGVGGRVVEMNTQSLEYVSRMARASGHMQPGEVDRLDMGGLYRRTAIEKVGYMSDRNLHSYEEFDLAVRLRADGWRLWRLDVDAVRHYGHDAPEYTLLRKRWKSGYICGLGELVRAAWGQAHLPLVIGGARELKIYVATLVWWLLALSSLIWPVSWAWRLAAFAIILALPVLAMAWRKKSLRKSLFSVVSWTFNGAGLVRGLLAPRKSAHDRIGSVVVLDAVVK